MTINPPLEDLRQRQDLQHRHRRPDFFGVPSLIRLANRRRTPTDGGDRLGPQLGVHNFLRAVTGEIQNQFRISRPPHHLAEDQAAVQLGSAIEIEQRDF